MTPDEAGKAISARFATLWGTTTAFILDNESNRTVDAGTAPWARLSVQHQAGGQLTLAPVGSRIYDRTGLIFVQIFTPKDSGTQRGFQLAHQARAVFEGNSFSGVDCFNGRVRPVGPDGKWYSTLVELDFTYSETK